jgi:hypothetical protein
VVVWYAGLARAALPKTQKPDAMVAAIRNLPNRIFSDMARDL